MKHFSDERGQAFTLEAIFAALLLLSAVVFALQVTAVTPLTSSTSSQQIENQQAATAEGFLAASAERDILRQAILMWNTTPERWHNTDTTEVFSGGPPNTEFGDQLNKTFIEWGVATNVAVRYQSEPDSMGDRIIKQEPMVVMGEPSENAVTAKYSLTLYDDDRIYDATGTRTLTTIKSVEDRFYAPDADPYSKLYNVVTIEVTVWRI